MQRKQCPHPIYARGKVKELTHELSRFQWGILGLAEVRWTCFGETTTEEGHKLWHSGEESKHQNGVAFLVNKNTANAVIKAVYKELENTTKLQGKTSSLSKETGMQKSAQMHMNNGLEL